MAASEKEESERDRQLLVRLFSYLDQSAAVDWASGLINEFGTIGTILTVSIEARIRVTKDRRPSEMLDVVADTAVQILRSRASAKPIIGSLSAVASYLMGAQAHGRTEIVRALFLDAHNRLLTAETLTKGSLDRAEIASREILKRALEVDAASIILAHNHPSGDPTPSDQDVIATRKLQALAKSVGVELHDHLIIAAGGWCSLRERGLLD